MLAHQALPDWVRPRVDRAAALPLPGHPGGRLPWPGVWWPTWSALPAALLAATGLMILSIAVLLRRRPAGRALGSSPTPARSDEPSPHRPRGGGRRARRALRLRSSSRPRRRVRRDHGPACGCPGCGSVHGPGGCEPDPARPSPFVETYRVRARSTCWSRSPSGSPSPRRRLRGGYAQVATRVNGPRVRRLVGRPARRRRRSAPTQGIRRYPQRREHRAVRRPGRPGDRRWLRDRRGGGAAAGRRGSGAGARRRRPGDNAAQVAESIGGVAHTVDVTDAAAVDRLVAAGRRRSGSLDVVVHTAGVDDPQAKAWLLEARESGRAGRRRRPAHRRGVAPGDLDQPRRHLPRASGRRSRDAPAGERRDRDRGSSAAFDTLVGYPHYAASKAAVHALSQSVAKEAIAFGIRVNTVAPGPVDTPMAGRTPAAVRAGDGGHRRDRLRHARAARRQHLLPRVPRRGQRGRRRPAQQRRKVHRLMSHRPLDSRLN